MNSPSVKKTEKRKRWQNKQNKVFFSSSLSSLWGHRTMYFFVEIVKKKDPSKGSFCWSPLFHFTAKKVSYYNKPIITLFSSMYSKLQYFQIWGKSTRTILLSRLSPKAVGLANEFWMSLPESFELIQLRNMYVPYSNTITITHWAKITKRKLWEKKKK